MKYLNKLLSMLKMAKAEAKKIRAKIEIEAATRARAILRTGSKVKVWKKGAKKPLLLERAFGEVKTS